MGARLVVLEDGTIARRPEPLREHGPTEAELLCGYAQCAGGAS